MRVLVVSFGPISETRSGYFNLVNESVKAIRKHCDVGTIEFVDENDFSKVRELNDQGRFFVRIKGGMQGGFWYSKIITISLKSLELLNTVKKYDVVLIETSVFFPFAIIGKIFQKKVIFATHGMILEMAWHNKKRPVKYLEQLFQAYFLDKISSKISDITLVTSNHDKELAIKYLHFDQDKIKIRPVVVSIHDVGQLSEYAKSTLRKRLGIPEGVFIGIITGDYSAEQNQKALDFLFSTEHLFPDNFVILVIGKTNGRYSSTGKIRVLGYVENVSDYYELVNGLILPLSTGMGIKTKIIESMAHGLRIFTTSIGLLGIDLEGSDGIYTYDLTDFWERFKLDISKTESWEKCKKLIDLYLRKYSNGSMEKSLSAILCSLNDNLV